MTEPHTVRDPMIASLSDGELGRRLEALAGRERAALVEVLRHLAEFDRRRLFANVGYSSMFAYCTKHLRYSESSAYRRILVARLLGRFSFLADHLAAGRATLTTLAELAPLLTDENARELVDRAAFASKREVERLVASLAPRPDPADSVRRLPGLRPATSAAPCPEPPPAPATMPASPVATPPSPPAVVRPAEPPSRRDVIAPLSERRTKIEFTVGDEFVADLEMAKAQLSHKYPHGRLEDVLGEALRALARERARSRSAGVPASVRRAVHERDGGRCTYQSDEGVACGSRHQVEYDHVVPVAAGGASTVHNGRELCRVHNQLQARLWFGAELMERKIAAAREARGPARPVVATRPAAAGGGG